MPLGAECCSTGQWCPSGTSCTDANGAQICKASTGTQEQPSSSAALVNSTGTAAMPSSTGKSEGIISQPKVTLAFLMLVSLFMICM
jgi:hypothetical protein